MSSQKLVESFQTNDSKLLASIYSSQFPKLRQFVLANNGNGEQAKDIFQEAFIITWENIRKKTFIPGNRSEIHGYLYRVATNKWLDYVRSATFKKNVGLADYHEKTEEVEQNREQTYLQIEQGLKTLGGKCREILKRFYYRKESMAEIAEAFGWTEQTARNNKYRCIQQLRNEMKGLEH